MKRLRLVLLALMLFACEQEMAEQPRYDPYEAAPGWPDDQSARLPVPGTVARSDRLEPEPTTLPVPLTRTLLETGRKQFDIFCAPCHGKVGAGDGMVVQRGFPAPPTLHEERLRQVPLRHFYDVMTDGFGVMYSYASRVTPPERWAIAAYIRALQLSQHGEFDELTPTQRKRLEAQP
ncbi:c-type cytochrome [Marinimicrobium locisalis]|uniref:c-type cytochrome n=1 Tax=Marinimicrobium locisalis TaxID=546022 RepID=UPI0032221DA5